ncbi:MAG: diguanylate cyclase [Gemmatimonadaceae bacterium]|nr:diguanylate cyclase [Gemmatimonadaceae bacterium]
MPDGETVPEHLTRWIAEQGLTSRVVETADELMACTLRSRFRVVLFDGRQERDTSFAACTRLKADAYTAIIPAAVLLSSDAELEAGFKAGADEVVVPAHSESEIRQRLNSMLLRADRDIEVHPSTRLAGAPAIAREITRRIDLDQTFAVCYADLDHFKEYNDRYSYTEGDRVIRILAKVLHDVVKGICGERGFVGHIGGDDFIYIIPYDDVAEVCGEVVAVFDLLVPYQYSEPDRNTGYFFGKDRRGHLDRVPLMTLSIGVVTNGRRKFTHAAQVSHLATEMKTYAKTLPGSLYAIDRRTDERFTPPHAVPAFAVDRVDESSA